jgi:arylsulfatase A-like enzyme
MMALGAAVDKPQIIERPIHHIDLCPTLANLLGCPLLGAQGQRLAEVRG